MEGEIFKRKKSNCIKSFSWKRDCIEMLEKKKIHTIDPLRLKLFWNILILWLRSRGIFESGFSSDVSATTSGKLCRFIFRSMRLYFTSSNSRFLSENLSGSDDRLKIERVIDGWALRDIYISLRLYSGINRAIDFNESRRAGLCKISNWNLRIPTWFSWKKI